MSELKGNSKLVVSRLDRLSRKVIDTLKLVDDFKREHKEICITDIGNIHKDGVSKVFVTILASLAEIERENISQRIKELEEEGYYVIKLIKTNKNGIPDVVAIPPNCNVIFSEIKTKKGKVSKLQEYRLKELKKHGVKTEVYRGD